MYYLAIYKYFSHILLHALQNDENVVEAHWKGAAEIILGLCTRFVNEHGEAQVMTAEKVDDRSNELYRREVVLQSSCAKLSV